MPTFVQILDFIGTFAFAISGIRLASAKRFDWFGAYVVGFVTAIGGGTIRDLLLDVTPGWMTDPIYLICTGLALLWVILFGKHLIHLHNTFFIFDSIGLAEATIYLATSPKSNSAYMAINNALELVRETGNLPVPLHLRNAPTKLMKQLGYGEKYKYAHDYPGNFVKQQFLPDELKDRRIWEPQLNPAEQKHKERMQQLWGEEKKW